MENEQDVREDRTPTEAGPTTTPPAADPCGVYPEVPGIDCGLYRLSPQGLPADQRAEALRQIWRHQARQKANFLGYQCNQRLDYAEDLGRHLDFHINNIGDPFHSGKATINTKEAERAVLDYYAALWNARWPHDPRDGESYWGYVLTMGSTEGNLYGLWNARDYLAGKILLEDPTSAEDARRASLDGDRHVPPRRLVYQQAQAPDRAPNAYTPVAFYSQDTHYSIVKAVQSLAIQTFYEIGAARYPNDNPLAPGRPWPREVPSIGGRGGAGVIDVDALATLVEFFASRGYPIFVCFNYGTTFKGAYDDVEAAGRALLPILRRHGLSERKVHYDPGKPEKVDVRSGYWFHVDGALGAAYMPFLEMAHGAGRSAARGPNFDFRLPFVHSIVMSGHKWIGAPWPCGVYMTRTKLLLRPPSLPEYIGSPDTTFAGSRNGWSAVVLWDHLAKRSYEDQIAKALYTESMAAYAERRLLELQEALQQDLWVARVPLSLTVRFKAVNPALEFKYSLAGETVYVAGEKRTYNHIYLMEHATAELIDAFLDDLAQPGAFPPQDTAARQPPPNDADTAADHGWLVYVPHTGRGFRG
jgi:histidine decarboxylase